MFLSIRSFILQDFKSSLEGSWCYWWSCPFGFCFWLQSHSFLKENWCWSISPHLGSVCSRSRIGILKFSFQLWYLCTLSLTKYLFFPLRSHKLPLFQYPLKNLWKHLQLCWPQSNIFQVELLVPKIQRRLWFSWSRQVWSIQSLEFYFYFWHFRMKFLLLWSLSSWFPLSRVVKISSRFLLPGKEYLSWKGSVRMGSHFPLK